MGNLLGNGGATLTHALLTGSPAIDAGDPATCATTDQRGVARPQGAACDIGAFEGSASQTLLPVVRTYTANHNNALPGTLVCDQPDACASTNTDASRAHQSALGTYNFYLSHFGRNGIDNNNMPIISTVQYEIGYKNAFWNGAQMILGDGYGFANADDIMAHELTHGVTQYESNLLYFYQSGAIDESFSDLWGEYFDQVNGTGNDSPYVKWLIGEDVTGKSQPAFRNMANPPQYSHPDKISSSYYYMGEGDNGGVHTNSGVNNKAAYLMVEGGTF
ncbi:MAG: M4 family metallopeptidase [Anaerolineales bacterium]